MEVMDELCMMVYFDKLYSLGNKLGSKSLARCIVSPPNPRCIDIFFIKTKMKFLKLSIAP